MKFFNLLFAVLISNFLSAQKPVNFPIGKWFGESFSSFEIDSFSIRHSLHSGIGFIAHGFEYGNDTLKFSSEYFWLDEYSHIPFVLFIESYSKDSIKLKPISKIAKIAFNWNATDSTPSVFHHRNHFYDEKIKFEEVEFATTSWTGTPKTKVLKIDSTGQISVFLYQMASGKLEKVKTNFKNQLPSNQLEILKELFKKSELESLSNEFAYPTNCDDTDFHFKLKYSSKEKEYVSSILPELLRPLKDFLEKIYNKVDFKKPNFSKD